MTARQASDPLFRAVFERAKDAILISDDHGRYVDANPAACELFGLPREDLLGRTVHEFAAPAYDTPERWAAFQSDGAQNGQFPLLRKDGTSRVLEYVAVTNVLPGLHLSILRDVTDRDEADRRNRLFAAIVESSHDAIISKTLDGTITSWNAAAEQLYGYTEQEALGRNVLMLFPPGRHREEEDILQRLAAGQRVERLETVRVRKDGSEVDVLLTISPVKDASGRVVGASKIVHDLTERRRAEAALRKTETQLRQAQKMEAVGVLAGGIAHDFNNVLSVILSYSDMMAESVPASDPLRLDAIEIRKSAQRGAELTRQLLAFSRQQILQPQVLDLNGVIANMERMLRRVLGEHIELFVLPAPSVDRIEADPSQIEQVLMNLVVNARDAMPRGGKLSIETSNVVLDTAYAAQHHDVKPGRTSCSPSQTPGRAWTPRHATASSSHSSRRRKKAKARGSGYRRSTAS